MSPRRNRDHNPVATAPTPKPEVDIQRLIDASVEKKLAGIAIEEFNCRACFQRSNNSHCDKICRSCERHGERPSLVHYIARRLGWTTGAPSDLVDVLKRGGLSEEAMWTATQEELAAIWDSQTTELLATTVTNLGMFVVGNMVSNKLEFGDYLPTPSRQRPLLPSEREEQLEEAKKQVAANDARRRASRLRAAEVAAQKTNLRLQELNDERTREVGSELSK